ncbi:MAG: acyl-CoA carboxylase subunit epsilon [Actinobacteria bacterium]|nr:acyl-CoA carboxylase subunit epsilon [Actinomycetota bacterium]
MTDETTTPEPTRPLLRVVKGDPTADELAALVAVVTSLSTPVASATPDRPLWGRPELAHRRPLTTGAAAWRHSSLPH